MRINIVFTLTGTDRIGIVEEVTQLLLDLDGNVETSRMARLGGEFAIVMLLSLPAGQLANLDKAVETLTVQGYKVTAIRTEQTYAEAHAGWLPYQIELHGADHEGIVHQIAHHLSQRGISIETMDTSVTQAPVSGTPLFTMMAQVVVPPGLHDQGWEATLQEVGHHLNVDIKVVAVQ